MQRIQRSIVAVLLLVALLFSSVVPAFAQDVAPDTPDETNHVYLPAILGAGAQGDVEAAGKASGQAVPFKGDRMAAVMTRNLYLGAALEPLLIPGLTRDQFALAVGAVYKQAMESDIPDRMKAVANEIAKEEPGLIGLQEVATWTTGTFLDPADATNVEYDFLKLLLSDLAEKGLVYEPKVIVTGFNAEAPAVVLDNQGVPVRFLDVRLTVSDVLLARSDLKTADLKLSNPQGANYYYSVSLTPPGGTPIPFLRQWASVDVKIRGKSFRFITTHLESFDEQVRVAQAQELLAVPAATSLPTIIVGDFNSQPSVQNDAADIVIDSGFTDVWPAANPGDGYTCCQAPDLRNLPPQLPIPNQRIDLVLARGGFGVSSGAAQLTGTTPLNLQPSGVQWASDHFGVAAVVQVPK